MLSLRRLRIPLFALASGTRWTCPRLRRASWACCRRRGATARIEYYVEASDHAFASTRTPERTVDVVGSAGECRKDALVAPFATSARLVVTAAPGAPAVPAGFLGAGLASAGGVGAGTLAVVGAGAAASAGVAVAAGGGGGPDGDPTPTTLAEPTIAGAWVGLGGDGLHRESTQSVAPAPCRHEDDLYLDLIQSGGTITGAARYVSRVGATCEIPPGATFRTDVRGTIDGQQVRLTLTAALPAGDYSEELVGILSGSRMEGTVTGNWRDGPRTGQIRGTWSARRP